VIPPEAIQAFAERQRQLVHDSYDKAWQQGVEGYEPDADPEDPTPAHQHRGEEASLGGLLLLKARTNRVYGPPSAPDPARRQQALAGALKSTERMTGELAQLSPTPEHFEEAQAEVDASKIAVEGLTAAALGMAVAEWAESNAYRLDSGASVAWAGEQAGYAESANTAGDLIQWQSEDDESVCEDCEGLEAMGPMPLEDFPTMPGEGSTTCNIGCRCAMEAVSVEPLPNDELAPLSEEDSATLEKVAGQAQERMDKLAPNFAMTG
jgi:hypothetical protein